MLFNFILTYIIIVFLVYSRFFHKDPYLLDSIDITVAAVFVIFFGLLFLNSIFRVLRYRQVIGKVQNPITLHILRRLAKLSTGITSLFKEFHMVVLQYRTYTRINLIVVNFWWNLTYWEKVLLLMMFVFIPQCLTCGAFLLDIFYIHKFVTFPNILIILGYPMLFNTYLGILNHIHSDVKPVYEDFMHIIPYYHYERLIYGYYYNYDFAPIEDLLTFFKVSDYNEYNSKIYIPLLCIRVDITRPFERIKSFFGLFISLLTFGCYFIGWSYILLFVLIK